MPKPIASASFHKCFCCALDTYNFAYSEVQVNLCQKLLFLHQLTHNMATNCSWNYHEIYKHRTCSAYVLPMFCTCSFHCNSMNNLLSYFGLVDATISAPEKDLPVQMRI